MMSIWDPKENTSLRIDLWTKEMLVDDMKRFFYENFMTMADTYQRATNDEVNVPENGSRTRSPGFELALMILSNRAIGF